MIKDTLSTLKINKLTQAQYDAALVAGTIQDNELYMTPDDNELDTTSFLRVSDVGSAVDPNPVNADMLGGKSAGDFALKTDLNELAKKSELEPLATKTELNAKAPLASPTFTGTPATAANTNYTTAQLRNITLSTADPSGGSNGDIWIKYKA